MINTHSSRYFGRKLSNVVWVHISSSGARFKCSQLDSVKIPLRTFAFFGMLSSFIRKHIGFFYSVHRKRNWRNQVFVSLTYKTSYNNRSLRQCWKPQYVRNPFLSMWLCLEKFSFSSSLVKCVRKVREKKEKEKHVTHLFPAQGKW